MKPRHICATCKNKGTCECYREDRQDWTCMNYEEEEHWQITLADIKEVMTCEKSEQS